MIIKQMVQLEQTKGQLGNAINDIMKLSSNETL